MELRKSIGMGRRGIVILAVAIAGGCASSGSRLVSPSSASRGLAAQDIDPRAYADALTERLRRIPEFEEIRKWAEARKVRVWLAGGSATGIGAYLREELQTGAADAQSFPYSYFDIYRSTQDADIVLDAGEEEAWRLEAMLREKLGYLQGSKEVWEVRLLKQSRGKGVGKKDPIIGSADFRNQNSDSYSTGLIEVTTPPEGESRIRDAFDWENHRDPAFLSGLLEGKITFYRNPLHSRTARAVAGYNPEIISVIRALTKAFQYDAVVTDAGLAKMRKIVDGFDPHAALGPEAVRYVLGNAAKLYQHARDLEEAEETLRNLGLLDKLRQFAQKHRDISLARFLYREPLRGYPLGQAPFFTDVSRKDFGKTAAQLGIDVVAHETGDFLAYENITMSRRGRPNFFVSRANTPGEAAIHGNGVYTARGRTGARGTQLTIRFAVDPRAVCGRDFFVAAGNYVVFRNANAFRRLPEDALSLSVVEYADLLDQGGIQSNDLGVMKKLELKLRSQSSRLSPDEIAEISDRIADGFAKWKGYTRPGLGYLLGIGVDHPALLKVIERAFLRNPAIPFEQKFDTAASHGLLVHYADAAASDGSAAKAVDLLLERRPYGEAVPRAMRRLLSAVSDEELRTLKSVHEALDPQYFLGYGEGSPVYESRLLLLERARTVFPQKAPDFARRFLENGWDVKFLGALADRLERMGFEESVCPGIVVALKRRMAGSWAYPTELATVRAEIFPRLNRCVRKRAEWPKGAAEWIFDPRNPEYVDWMKRIPDPKRDLRVLGSMVDHAGLPELFDTWRGIFESVREHAPKPARQMALSYVRSARDEHRSTVIRYLTSQGYGAEMETYVLKELQWWENHGSYWNRPWRDTLFVHVNEQMLEYADPAPALWKWARHPHNPERLRWMKAWFDRAGDPFVLLEELAASPMHGAEHAAFVGRLLRKAGARDPARASKAARRCLSAARVHEFDQIHAYFKLLRTVRDEGLISAVEDEMDSRLRWLENPEGRSRWYWEKEGQYFRTKIYSTLTEHLEARDDIPRSLRKWALESDHPGHERLRELPVRPRVYPAWVQRCIGWLLPNRGSGAPGRSR